MQSEKIDELALALSEVAGKIENPSRNRKVTVNPNTPDQYEFTYATLDAILAEVRPLLAEHGLSIVQAPTTTEKGGLSLVTSLVHKSGQSISVTAPIFTNGEKGNQAIGAAITYARRHALCAFLNITAEDDDDAETPEGTKKKVEANPTARQKFCGPLTISQLKAHMRQFAGEVPACEDESALDGLLVGMKPILEQCERDLPDWYFGKGDDIGAKARIEAKRKELSE